MTGTRIHRHIVAVVIMLISAVLLPVLSCKRQTAGNRMQIYENRYNITVTGLRMGTEWDPMPRAPNSDKLKSTPDTEIAIVDFEVTDLTTNQPAAESWNLLFGGFVLEDVDGKRYASRVLNTSGRNIGIGVPKGARLKYFLMSGLKFDIEGIARL
jgi:hypothetical protein